MAELMLFDIDGTLFSPEIFGKKIRARFSRMLNIDEEELIRANADYYSNLETTTDFNPHDITVFIAQRFGADAGALDRVFWEEDVLYKESLFEDAEEVLEGLENNYILGIYSQGFEEYQKRKLTASGIDKYFKQEYMFFYRRKISDEAIALLPVGSTVVDDNHDVVTKISPFVNAIWMNRRTEDKDPSIRTIHNLRELL